MQPKELLEEVGNIDIYLLDQLLKGKITKEMRLLDAGCGEGRNSYYFLKNGFDIYGVDSEPVAIRMVQMQARTLGHPQPDNFLVSSIEGMPFPDGFFDWVICSAVLHFASSTNHFHLMLAKLADILKPGGTLFIRMATDVGIVHDGRGLPEGLSYLPDGSTRYLLKESEMQKIFAGYKLDPAEDFRSVVIHGQRAMGAIVLKKTN